MSTTQHKDIIIDELKRRIAGFEKDMSDTAVGTVIAIGDGIVTIEGLPGAEMSEMLSFDGHGEGDASFGVVMDIEEGHIGAIVLGEYRHIKEGDTVTRTKRILEVPVGEDMIGRVVNPLGEPLDAKGPIIHAAFYPVERVAPGVVTRKSVSVPMQTGIKAIDAMVPVGRGQRELIIGDRQTGKTAIAIDAIVNQKGKNMKCVYVAIGQKESKIAGIVAKLEEKGAMEYTTVVLAGASDPASLSYIAPFAGTSIAEYFLDKGEDVLVIYDDLSKHAVAYREISLLLRRPPGREAYPGDVFYLHSRLLERACRLNENYGGGSITALPVIETQAGDVSAYIPTNVISITDGQIYLETDLFHQGVRPAVNAGLSVSRVGSSAQTKIMKKVAGKMRIEAAQYRELAAFAQFGSDVDEDTARSLERGKRLTEVLKQGQYAPISDEKQVLIFYALLNGFIDDVLVENVRAFERGLYEYVDTSGEKVMAELVEKNTFDDDVEAKLRGLLEDYRATLDYLEGKKKE